MPTPPTRRSLLRHVAGLSAGLLLGAKSLLAQEATPLTSGSQTPETISPDFIGLGYEMSSVASIGLLSDSNKLYVNLVKGLGASGVLRVGGIVADYTRYKPDGIIKATPKDTVITRASLNQFAAFLHTIGWKAIWSLNFAQGTLDDAIKEAAAVAAVLGDRLLCLELGNEVENYKNGQHPFRPPPYTYETWRTEFTRWRAAILHAVPSVHFAAPDTAANIDWVERNAEDAHGDVQLLTTHYYFSGQDHGKAEDLLQPDPSLVVKLKRLRAAANQNHIPWRMCEANSFSGGGLRGVSDTFLGALWTLDFMLLLAAYGCRGVNIETGVNQLGFISPYSPIQDDGQGNNSTGIPYYGMLAFAQARRGSSEIVTLQAPSASAKLTAYAFSEKSRPTSIVVINRDETDSHVSLERLSLPGSLHALRLTAPSASSKAGVTLAGASVDPDGTWHPKHLEPVHHPNILIPPMSAIIVRN